MMPVECNFFCLNGKTKSCIAVFKTIKVIWNMHWEDWVGKINEVPNVDMMIGLDYPNSIIRIDIFNVGKVDSARVKT